MTLRTGAHPRPRIAISGILILLLLLLFAVVLPAAQRYQQQTVYPLSTRETKAQEVMGDGTLLSYPLYQDNEKAVFVYRQDPEQYGESNSLSYAVCHVNGRDILLQDASLSLPEAVIFDGDSVYICGRTTAFSTVEGINITRYRCTADRVNVENAIDVQSLGDNYHSYQDEYNKSLVSIVPASQDGMGRISFKTVEQTAITATEITDSATSTVTFINHNGKFVLRSH